MKKIKRVLAGILAIALVAGIIPGDADAAKAPKLTNKKVTIKVGQKKTIKLKNGVKKAKVTWKVTGKAIKIKAKNTKGKKAYATIVGKKEGRGTLVANYKLGKKSKKLSCTVTVKASDNMTPAPVTDAPVSPTATNVVSASTPTVAPTATATVTAEPTKEPSKMIPIQEMLDDDNYDCPDGYADVNDDTAGELIDIVYPSTVITEGEEVMRKAKVALPKDYDSEDTETRYPVIYFNHGIGGNESTMPGDKVQNILWNAVDEGVAVPAIIVFGSGCANEYNGQGPNAFFSIEHYKGYNNFLNDVRKCLKPYIDEEFNTLTDRDHTAICGFSMGGRVTLHQGFAAQDLYRYVGAFCPAPGIFDFTDQGVTDEGLFEPEEFKIADEYVGDTLVMIAKGLNDGTVHKFPGEYHDALVENEVPHIFLEYPGGHDGSVFKPAFYNFVKRIFKEKN